MLWASLNNEIVNRKHRKRNMICTFVKKIVYDINN